MDFRNMPVMDVPGIHEAIENATAAEFEKYDLAIDRETEAHEALEYERMFVSVEKAEGDFERDREEVHFGIGEEREAARLRMVERVESFEAVQKAVQKAEEAERECPRARQAYLRVRDAAIRAHVTKWIREKRASEC